MIDIEKVKKLGEFVGAHWLPVIVGLLIGVGATVGLYEKFLMPHLRSENSELRKTQSHGQAPPSAAALQRKKPGESLSFSARPAFDDSRFWVQALVRDLIGVGQTALMIDTAKSADQFDAFTVVIRSAIQGSVSGYAFRCTGETSTSRCQLLGDKFAGDAPRISVPALQPGERLFMIVTLAEKQIADIGDLRNVLRLEVQ